jgi:hypothetical protein
LLNLLIAVVVDSYDAVKNEDSEEVFWSSRLEYVMEVEVMSNWFKNHFQNDFFSHLASMSKGFEIKCSYAWESLIKVYEDKRSFNEKAKDYEFGSECKRFIMPRLINILYIWVWLILGAVTAGLLWPPQIRKWLWARHGKSLKNEGSPKESNQDQELEKNLDDKLESIVAEIKAEIVKVKESIKLENTKIANMISQQRAEIAKVKSDIVDIVEKHKAETKSDNEKIVLAINNHKAEVKASNDQLLELNKRTNAKMDNLMELITQRLLQK